MVVTDSNSSQMNLHQVVAFIGLPSAGKSTLINSLAYKRLLQTGVCRTTKEVHLIGENNLFNFPPERFHKTQLVSDDGVPMSILDLPGLADAENKGTEKNFNEITNAWITNCNVIFWVSEIKSAFMTTHEKQEFDNVANLLKKITNETGTLSQLAILLSKYEYADEEKQYISSQQTTSDGEIVDGIEDTTISDCYKRVYGIFKEQVPIFKFNAFGRIMHNKKSSPLLQKLVSTIRTCTSNLNCQFNLQWAIKDLHNKQQLSFLKCLFNFHFKNIYEHNKCSHGTHIFSSCGYTSAAACGCNGYCNCGGTNHCSFHGPCIGGKNKLTDDTCPNGNSCKYHRADKCLFGVTFDGKTTCNNKYCPQHWRLKASEMQKTYNTIKELPILELIVCLLLTYDDSSYEKFHSQAFYGETIKTLLGLPDKYDEATLNLFAAMLGNRTTELSPIVDKLIDKNDFVKPSVLYRLIEIVGVDHLNVIRLYLNLIAKGSAASITSPNITFNLLSGIKSLNETIHSQYFSFDVDINTNSNCFASKKWQNSVAKTRRLLWGDDEDDISIEGLLVAKQRGGIYSILQHIVQPSP